MRDSEPTRRLHRWATGGQHRESCIQDVAEEGDDGTTVADVLVAGATLVATVDDDRRELRDGWVAVRHGLIDAVGSGAEPAARVRIEASGCLVTPGLVNTHHHLWQNLTRSYAPMTSIDFLGWLGVLYPLWSRIDAEGIYLSTRVGLAELALGGCTTTSDHLYLQPPDQPSFLDVQISAATESGLRFHATRGAVDRGQRDGSPMPDHMLEPLDDVLADCERLVATHHDRTPMSRLRVALGPHSVFGATSKLMAEIAALGARLDVRLHTHLSGDHADDGYCVNLHGCRPVEWLESLGWIDRRTWVAHCFFPNAGEIARLGAARVGVAHCATAGLLMGVGVAPVPEMRAAGIPVGLGVDGSSNSDAGSLWLEARMALLANRFRSGPAAFSARDALELATRGGATCLGRDGEIGVLAAGANADIAVWPIEGVPWAGAVSDPIEAWLRCGPTAPRHVLVGGEPVVRDGVLVQDDIGDLLARHTTVARRLQEC
jgi:cytosine/adenosine deaminase-related metal-dependent hydrolase